MARLLTGTKVTLTGPTLVTRSDPVNYLHTIVEFDNCIYMITDPTALQPGVFTFYTPVNIIYNDPITIENNPIEDLDEDRPISQEYSDDYSVDDEPFKLHYVAPRKQNPQTHFNFKPSDTVIVSVLCTQFELGWKVEATVQDSIQDYQYRKSGPNKTELLKDLRKNISTFAGIEWSRIRFNQFSSRKEYDHNRQGDTLREENFPYLVDRSSVIKEGSFNPYGNGQTTYGRYLGRRCLYINHEITTQSSSVTLGPLGSGSFQVLYSITADLTFIRTAGDKDIVGYVSVTSGATDSTNPGLGPVVAIPQYTIGGAAWAWIDQSNSGKFVSRAQFNTVATSQDSSQLYLNLKALGDLTTTIIRVTGLITFSPFNTATALVSPQFTEPQGLIRQDSNSYFNVNIGAIANTSLLSAYVPVAIDGSLNDVIPVKIVEQAPTATPLLVSATTTIPVEVTNTINTQLGTQQAPIWTSSYRSDPIPPFSTDFSDDFLEGSFNPYGNGQTTVVRRNRGSGFQPPEGCMPTSLPTPDEVVALQDKVFELSTTAQTSRTLNDLIASSAELLRTANKYIFLMQIGVNEKEFDDPFFDDGLEVVFEVSGSNTVKPKKHSSDWKATQGHSGKTGDKKQKGQGATDVSDPPSANGQPTAQQARGSKARLERLCDRFPKQRRFSAWAIVSCETMRSVLRVWFRATKLTKNHNAIQLTKQICNMIMGKTECTTWFKALVATMCEVEGDVLVSENQPVKATERAEAWVKNYTMAHYTTSCSEYSAEWENTIATKLVVLRNLVTEFQPEFLEGSFNPYGNGQQPYNWDDSDKVLEGSFNPYGNGQTSNTAVVPSYLEKFEGEWQGSFPKSTIDSKSVDGLTDDMVRDRGYSSVNSSRQTMRPDISAGDIYLGLLPYNADSPNNYTDSIIDHELFYLVRNNDGAGGNSATPLQWLNVRANVTPNILVTSNGITSKDDEKYVLDGSIAAFAAERAKIRDDTTTALGFRVLDVMSLLDRYKMLSNCFDYQLLKLALLAYSLAPRVAPRNFMSHRGQFEMQGFTGAAAYYQYDGEFTTTVEFGVNQNFNEDVGWGTLNRTLYFNTTQLVNRNVYFWTSWGQMEMEMGQQDQDSVIFVPKDLVNMGAGHISDIWLRLLVLMWLPAPFYPINWIFSHAGLVDIVVTPFSNQVAVDGSTPDNIHIILPTTGTNVRLPNSQETANYSATWRPRVNGNQVNISYPTGTSAYTWLDFFDDARIVDNLDPNDIVSFMHYVGKKIGDTRLVTDALEKAMTLVGRHKLLSMVTPGTAPANVVPWSDMSHLICDTAGFPTTMALGNYPQTPLSASFMMSSGNLPMFNLLITGVYYPVENGYNEKIASLGWHPQNFNFARYLARRTIMSAQLFWDKIGIAADEISLAFDGSVQNGHMANFIRRLFASGDINTRGDQISQIGDWLQAASDELFTKSGLGCDKTGYNMWHYRKPSGDTLVSYIPGTQLLVPAFVTDQFMRLWSDKTQFAFYADPPPSVSGGMRINTEPDEHFLAGFKAVNDVTGFVLPLPKDWQDTVAYDSIPSEWSYNMSHNKRVILNIMRHALVNLGGNVDYVWTSTHGVDYTNGQVPFLVGTQPDYGVPGLFNMLDYNFNCKLDVYPKWIVTQDVSMTWQPEAPASVFCQTMLSGRGRIRFTTPVRSGTQIVPLNPKIAGSTNKIPPSARDMARNKPKDDDPNLKG